MKDLFSVTGKTVIVTGGSRGIGRMIAAGFLANGAKVYITARKAAVCDATAAELQDEYGGECHSIPADLASLDGITSFCSKFRETEDHLDVLINNAGVSWGAPLEEFPELGWDKVMNTNVKGPFFLIQNLLPELQKTATHAQPTHIVNVGSIDGIKTPIFENFSYGPSKAAIHHLTRVLAAHLIKRHIIVNGIAPGPFPTYMLSTGVGGGGDTENTDWDAVGRSNPRGRVGTPEDIAGLAIFLSSRACGFTVGDIITCDGGSVVS